MTNTVASYEFDRGETISLALLLTAGDPADISDIVAKLKAVPWGKSSPSQTDPVAAMFDVAAFAAQGSDPAGYTFTIAAVTSSGLAPGKYHADVSLTVAGGVLITDPVEIIIRQSVSG